MTPNRTGERAAGWAALVALGGAAAVPAAGVPVLIGLPLAAFGVWAAAAAALTAARLRAARRAEEERQDLERARATAQTPALFESDAEGDLLSAQRPHRWIERWAVPPFAPLAGAALMVLGVRHLQLLRDAAADPSLLGLSGPAAAGLAVAAFVSALAARYLAVLARPAEHHALRAPASTLACAALAAGLAAAGGAAAQAGAAEALRWTAAALGGALLLAGAEAWAAALWRYYRPRAPEEGPGGFHSPIGLALADPGRFTRPAAESVDYQFGFKVSETWFYRFAERALLPLAVFQAAVLYGLSAVVVLGPEEAAIRERLGRPLPDARGGRLGPGLTWKAPWPFETVRRFPVQRVHQFHVGFTHPEDRMPREMLWARPHFESEDRFLTASRDAERAPGGAAPTGLLAVNLPVQYRVADLRAWLYGHADPETTLRRIALRALTREAAARDWGDILGPGQRAFEAALRERIQADSRTANLGVEIVFVGLSGVHPPVPVVPDFEDVVGAMEDREARILDSRAYAARRVPEAEGDAATLIAAAAGDAAHRAEIARAEAESFEERRSAARAAPTVYRGRTYFAALERALRGARLYLLAGEPDREVVQFNFEDRTPSPLFDWSPPGEAEDRARRRGPGDEMP
jgi:modulator of FtsH protease HflK